MLGALLIICSQTCLIRLKEVRGNDNLNVVATLDASLTLGFEGNALKALLSS